ncbi:cell wall elongation regulator TseB-like domain-containing protein [Halalkalibacter nanhaiisediminis]|uniref:Uncharacterized protein YpmB n=1 Tax=Halalkalibacter nanhaiisediminis TaxID=688079 RepID=A0A562QQ92_9BACI|nr:DUF5590 domain-containing protein [Halalkalibacter nanhaiisediminis]TWI58904.1 uncharacterized protein YpmB [Halalkalibacter nanhaiisediminis]
MKKWLFISLFVVAVIFISASVFAYQTVRSPLLNGFEQAEQFVRDQTLLATISDIDYYHGTTAYYVLQGENQAGEETIVWIRDDFDSYHIELSSDGISEDEALAIWQNEVNDISRLKSIRLGIERGIPIYEVVYTTVQNSKGYYYIRFEDGEFVKRYQLRAN